MRPYLSPRLHCVERKKGQWTVTPHIALLSNLSACIVSKEREGSRRIQATVMVKSNEIMKPSERAFLASVPLFLGVGLVLAQLVGTSLHIPLPSLQFKGRM